MGVGLKPHLPDGTYTATYRVISADTHIVYGGLVFNIGHPGRRAEVHGRRPDRQATRRGRVTKVAFGVVRGAGLPVDRADDRRPAVPAGGLGARRWAPSPAPSRAGRWPRRAFARAGRPAARGRGRARRARQRARRPAAGSQRRGRVAVELAESHGHRKHARKPLRRGCGRCGRSTGCCSARCCSPRERAGRDPCPARSTLGRRPRPRAARGVRRPPRVAAGGARARLRLPRDHPGARRSRQHPEPDAACSSPPTCSTSWPPACGWGGSPACCSRCPLRPGSSRARERTRLLLGDAARVLAARARSGDRDRRHGRGPGLHRRAQLHGLLHTHLRRADHRQDGAAGGADRARLGQPRAPDPGAAAHRGRRRQRRAAPGCWRAARCAASSP